MNKKNLILVTGLLRSGTTWTGKTIAAAKGIKYLNEPFNLDRQRKNCPFKYYYQFIDSNDKISDQTAIIDYINHISQSPTFYVSDQMRLMFRYKAFKNILPLLWGKKNFFGRPLMKDPIAILSAEWIYKTFGADVVIVLRHPAAFIGSLKTAGWAIPFPHLLEQKRMLNMYFNEFIPKLESYSKNHYDVIDQGILIWNIVYSRIKYYSDIYKNEWYFIKHEALSKNSIVEYTKLFNFLGIEFSDKIKSIIAKSSDGSSINHLSRNSVQNLETWKTRLTQEEISRIKSGTSNLYSYFYDEKDWN